MPLTDDGRKVLKDMKKQYGAKQGEEVFYRSINAKIKGSDKWHSYNKEKKHADVKKNKYSEALSG